MKHIMNEQLKRLETTETKCAYCSMENNADKNDSYYIPLFSVKDRTNIIVYSSVKYAKIDVGIPRCTSCREIHTNAGKKATLYAVIAAIATWLIAIALFNFFGGVFGLLAALLVGFGGQHFLKNKFVRDQDILTLKDGAETNETVQALVISGWTFTQPSA